ncbi:MAG: putative replicase protein [Lipwuvirus nemorishabitans]|uniref:RNA-directed RNA polymerase n=1 Tax=Leviviridae sp. TaxID=2027243 RepID=A0ABY3SU77_9VIRU|nr:MAG: putative replicase protein [Leviviridae sp.]
MKNSYADYLLGVYQAILSDLSDSFPFLRRDAERDYSRLVSLVNTRGLAYLTLDLVQAAKHFDSCLANELLVPYKMAGFRPWKKGHVVPRLFKGLHQQLFHEGGELRVDCDPLLIKYLRQLLMLAKKTKLECTDVRKWQAISDFFAIESQLPRSPEWDFDRPIWTPPACLDFRDLHRDPDRLVLAVSTAETEEGITTSDLAEKIFMSFRQISSQLGVFRADSWRPRHGPGAVSDQVFGGSKYEFPSWPDKLDAVFPLADFGFPNYRAWMDFVSEKGSRFSKNEYPSKLILVPKTMKSPRLIASEPISHQWCQQSILDFISHRIDHTFIGKFIHLRDQTYNARAAIQASHDQKLVTIDLSSASDYVSTVLVEHLFGSNTSILDALHACRTRWVENSVDVKQPKFHKLRKFACMGSACTFPVQSLLFLGIALGSTLYARNLRPTLENIKALEGEVLVFGDDIVVPTDAAKQVIVALGLCGFVINKAKTFCTGKFRESCGSEAYDGHLVTPTYVLKQPSHLKPDSVLSALESGNNFVKNGLFTAGKYIHDQLRKLGYAFLSVDPESGVTGMVTPFYPDNSEFKTRYNRCSQRVEKFVHQPMARNKRLPDRGDSCLLQYFTEAPLASTPWRAGFQAKRPSVYLRRRWVPYPNY